MEKVTISKNGQALKNLGCHLTSVVEDQSEVFVFIDIKIDTSKTVKPIAVAKKPAANTKAEKVELLTVANS